MAQAAAASVDASALREAIAALHDALQANLSVRWFTPPRARSLPHHGSRLRVRVLVRVRVRVKGSGMGKVWA